MTSRSARPAASSQCETTRHAKRIRTGCPALPGRLDYALSGAATRAGITSGICGGTTPKQRAQIRWQHRAAA